MADSSPILLSPVVTRLGLLTTWWSIARWVSCDIPPWPIIAMAWLTSFFLLALVLYTRARRRMPLAVLITRVPAATFFFVLLALHGKGHFPLVLFSLAFAPPYFGFIDWRCLWTHPQNKSAS